MTMKKAKILRDLGKSTWYELSHHVEFIGDRGDVCTTFFVVLSTARVGGELEVLAFAADCDGHILSWYELEGSMQGTDDHRRVLENMGYSL
jgi:hypothetical protein